MALSMDVADVNTDVAVGVMKSIQQLYSRQDLETDFIIEIDKTEIKCHRFILAPCSGFFSALFRSGMKEAATGRVSLLGISCETFELILRTIYTGVNVIIEDNVISLWQASNQLQIGFMNELCERCVIKMLSFDNLEEVLRNAHVINSKQVLAAIKQFMLEYFIQVRKMKIFPELSYHEIFELVSDQKLVVESEDQVLESILEWIEFPSFENFGEVNSNTTYKNLKQLNESILPRVGEDTALLKNKLTDKCEFTDCCKVMVNLSRAESNEKTNSTTNDTIDACPSEMSENNNTNLTHDLNNKTNSKIERTADDVFGHNKENILTKEINAEKRLSKIVPLLNAARVSLASVSCLDSLYNHRLINGNHEAKDIIFNAVLHHTRRHKNGAFSKTSLHRDSSEFGNFGVYSHGNGLFEAYSVTENKFFELPCCPECLLSVHLVVVGNDLYACGRSYREEVHSNLCLLKGDRWIKVVKLQGRQLFLLSHEETILILNIDGKIINVVNPKEVNKLRHNFSSLPDSGKFEYALVYDSKLIAFYSDTADDHNKTHVHCLDLNTKVWSRLDDLEGPAQHLISFQDEDNNYILQGNGNVWTYEKTVAGGVTFEFIGKLWDTVRVLHGAVHDNVTLTLFGDDPNKYQQDQQSVVSGFRYSMSYLGQDGACSNILPVVLAKTCFVSSKGQDFQNGVNISAVHFPNKERLKKYRIIH